MFWFFNLILSGIIVFLMTRKRHTHHGCGRLTRKQKERILNTFPEETREAYKSMMKRFNQEI